MARLIDRVANVWRNDLEHDPHRDAGNERDIREDQMRRIAEEMRDDLLGRSLVLKSEWANDLRLGNGPSVESIGDSYRARFAEINRTLGLINEMVPEITTRISVPEIEQAARRDAQINHHIDRAYEQLNSPAIRHFLATEYSAEASDGFTQDQTVPVPSVREWQTHKEREAEMDAEAARDYGIADARAAHLPAFSTKGLAEKQIAHSPTIREWISDLELERSHDNSMGMSL